MCNLAEGCNFFVFNNNEDKCTLKYGVGQQKVDGYDPKYVFGSKNCDQKKRTGRDMQLGQKHGGTLSAALPISAAGIGILLLIALISVFLCLR